MKKRRQVRVGLIIFIVGTIVGLLGALIKIQHGTIANPLLAVGMTLNLIAIIFIVIALLKRNEPLSNDWVRHKKSVD